ncbi:hypothetical protein [Desulfonatronum thiodismutans]|uniref:hypothetical protein n=1 Tax=Desulfonatronum thiodismutans TaxID=159290 RepID=UPI0004ABE7DC|nr:hypothetical protein [Desulfonatronum thiodismutans]
MYCPKCKHTSFDHLATCPKCGYDWQSIRSALNLNWLQSAGHEWLPESASEPPEAVVEPETSTVPEPMDFELDVEAAELFAFDEQTSDFDLSPPEESVQSEDTPAVSVAASAQDNFEVAPSGTRIEPDVADDTPLEADLFQAEVVSVDDADTTAFYQDGDTKPDFSEEAKTTEEELPVWEIELPQDLLPQDYLPEPVGEERGPVGTGDEREQDDVEVVGDIAYDFSEVEVVLPELDEAAQPPASRDSGSPPSPDGGDGTEPPSPGDHKEGR